MTTPAAHHNLAAGLVAAAVGSLAGAVVWAVLVSLTSFKIGYAAVGVGALAGFLGGRVSGGNPQLPPFAAGIGIVGCFIGDLLISAHSLAHYLSVSSFEVLTRRFGDVWTVYKYEFDFLSAVFYVLAGVAAFRLATQAAELAKQAAAAPVFAPPTTPPLGDVPPAP